MKLFYEEAANKPGVYKIVNTHTDRVYIGQAQNFKKRWYDHKRSLKNGRHGNRFFRNDFAKCFQELNHDDFIEFYILEIIEGSTKEERDSREEWYIAQYYDKQDRCYNFKQKSASKQRGCYSNTPEETSNLISSNSKKMWEKRGIKVREKFSKKMEAGRTKETYEKISKALIGIKRSKETIEKTRQANLGRKMKEEQKEARRNYRHTPEAKEKISKASKGNQYCRGKKQSEETIAKRTEKLKGKKRTEETKEKMRQANLGEKNPMYGKTLSKETKEKHSIASKNIWKDPEYRKNMIEKRTGHLVSEETRKKISSLCKTKNPVYAKNIDTNEIQYFDSITQAVKALNVKRNHIYEILKGKRKQTKGWTFYRSIM